jgi:hypothetical protein
MEHQFEMQRLLRRHSEIRHAMRQPGGVRVTVERELYAIAEQLKQFPAAQPVPQHPVPQTDSADTISRR